MMRMGLLTAVALMLAGCLGTAPKESFFTLSAPASPQPAGGASPTVLVGPVSVPEAVDRISMVIRTGPNRVEIDEANRWAEPLKAAIPRVLAENLRRELGTSRVLASRQASTSNVDFRVAVEVQRFDSSLDEGATLDALWTVTPATGAARTGETIVVERATSRDAGGLAAAHSRALEKLARDIAAAIKR
jgi:uncharacterized lipoprotein YmbA